MLAFLLVVVVVLPASMLVQSMAIALTVRFVVWLLRLGYAGRSFLRNVSVTTGVILILMTALLTQVALWAVAFVICGGPPGLRDGLLPLGRELHDPRLRRYRDGARMAIARPARGRERRPDVRRVGLRHVRRDESAARIAAQGTAR
jgi:hypothetical protein